MAIVLLAEDLAFSRATLVRTLDAIDVAGEQVVEPRAGSRSD